MYRAFYYKKYFGWSSIRKHYDSSEPRVSLFQTVERVPKDPELPSLI